MKYFYKRKKSQSIADLEIFLEIVAFGENAVMLRRCMALS
jgi:hypothetical protein